MNTSVYFKITIIDFPISRAFKNLFFKNSFMSALSLYFKYVKSNKKDFSENTFFDECSVQIYALDKYFLCNQ